MLHYNKIGVIGLNNNGNTCYLNACLQLLSHSGKLTLKLYNYMKNNEKKLTNIEKTLLYLIINKWFTNKINYNPLIIQKEIAKENDLALVIVDGEFNLLRIPKQSETNAFMLWGVVTYIIHAIR